MALNIGRVLLGGLIAGVVRLVGGVLVRKLIVFPLFLEELQRNHPSMATVLEAPSTRVQMVVLNLLMGITTMYVYAAMRLRFESRLATVGAASTAVWFIASLNWGITAAMGLFSWPHMIVDALTSLVVVGVATYLGSSVYKEADDARKQIHSVAPVAGA